MKVLIFLTTAITTFFVFQNCSPKQSVSGASRFFSVESIYPYYNEKPKYFDSVQLTKAYYDLGVYKYQFVASIVFIDDPSQLIDVEIMILDQDDKLLCPRVNVSVSNANNHIVIDKCQSGLKFSKAKIELNAKLHGEETLLPVRSYVFTM